MKKILIVALCLTSLSVFADDSSKEMNFADAKAKMLAHLDERIAHVNKAKECVNAATTKEALKACRDQMHQEGKAMRGDWKAKKQQWKSEKQAKKASKAKK